MKKNHKHNKDTNVHSDNDAIVMQVSKDYIVNKSEEELADLFRDIGVALKEFTTSQDTDDKCINMCDGCMYDERECDTSSEDYNNAGYVEDDYIDCVQYPLDSYIDPDLIDLRRLEGNYDYVVQYMAKCFRRTNEVAIQMLSEAHKMEMATLLEHLTQQNVLVAQTIIERIDARTLKPLESLELLELE